MRRVLSGVGLLAVLVSALVLAVGTGGATASDKYRVDAIFDTAKGIIPGQLVKIAGARVGTVKDVVLTPDYKARIEMEIEGKFAPFTSDASCEIQPEGLISENFVQCDPGSANGKDLQAVGGHAPTVPIERNSVPVNLTDLFQIWNVPTRDRLSIVLATLGIGAAGNGEDLNGLLRRANPALKLTRDAIDILRRQKAQVARVVTQTDRVLAGLAPRAPRVADFVVQSARVTRQTADHRTALAQAIRRLPGLLDATTPTLRRLDALTTAAPPLLRSLRASAPGLEAVGRDIPPFAAAARPAVRSLGATAPTGIRTAKDARPVITLLRRFAKAAGPTGTKLADLNVSLRDRGAVEGLLSFVYYGAAAIARYDGTSHILPAKLILNQCALYATSEVAGCSAKYNSTADLTPASRRRMIPPLRRTPAAPKLPTLPKLPSAATKPATAAPTKPIAPITDIAKGIVDALTGGDGGRTGRSDASGRQGLLDYLLK